MDVIVGSSNMCRASHPLDVLTITDSDTSQSETFVADATHGVQIDARTFAGIATGDQVDVTYHQSAGHLIADTVCDNGTSGDS